MYLCSRANCFSCLVFKRKGLRRRLDFRFGGERTGRGEEDETRRMAGGVLERVAAVLEKVVCEWLLWDCGWW